MSRGDDAGAIFADHLEGVRHKKGNEDADACENEETNLPIVLASMLRAWECKEGNRGR